MPTHPSRRALGLALRAIREERQLPLAEAGKAIDVHPLYLKGMEQGDRNPNWDQLTKVARLYGVPVSEIVLRAEHIEDGSR